MAAVLAAHRVLPVGDATAQQLRIDPEGITDCGKAECVAVSLVRQDPAFRINVQPPQSS